MVNLNQELKDLTTARFTYDNGKVNVNSYIASVYNLSHCPGRVQSGESEILCGIIKICVHIRNNCGAQLFQDVCGLLSIGIVSEYVVKRWIERGWCSKHNEYRAVLNGYSHL